MTSIPATILLATDGSPDARAAGRAAADMVRRTHATLHVVHAWDNYYGMGGVVPVAYPLLHEQGAQDLLNTELALIREAGGAVAGAHLRQGQAGSAIIEVAAEVRAGLILLGSRGHGGVHRLVMGSVAEAVVHHARVPVLVMRGSATCWPPRQIVVGDDSSRDAAAALRLAADFAGIYGARLTLVRALPHLEDELRQAHALEARVVDDVLEFARGELEDHAAALPGDVAARTTVQVSVAAPAQALLDAAEGESLIACGSRGLGALQRLRSGSVSTQVLRAAQGPLLVTPHAVEAPLLSVQLLGRHTAAR